MSLTSEQKEEIKHRLQSGERPSDIAAIYGVPKKVIHNIKHRRQPTTDLIQEHHARIRQETLDYLREAPRTNEDLRLRFALARSSATKRLGVLKSRGLADYHWEGAKRVWEAIA